MILVIMNLLRDACKKWQNFDILIINLKEGGFIFNNKQKNWDNKILLTFYRWLPKVSSEFWSNPDAIMVLTANFLIMFDH